MTQVSAVTSVSPNEDLPVKNALLLGNRIGMETWRERTVSSDDVRDIVYYYNGRTKNCSRDRKRFDNLERLYDIAQLKTNWDGENSEKIPESVIRNTKTFIENICRQPVIFPTGRQSIHMQYELEDTSYMEFEIFEDTITCMKVPQRVYAHAVFKTFQNLDMDQFNQIVEEFYGKNDR